MRLLVKNKKSVKKILLFSLLLNLFLHHSGIAQKGLPSELKISSEGLLTTGGNKVEGLYDPAKIRKIEFEIEEEDWFQIINERNFFEDAPEVSGTMIVDDSLVLDSVFVRIKGTTSDFFNDSEKKSFGIDIDKVNDQELLGYDNLNLNGGYEDPSYMREVLFYDITKNFGPALKGSFVELYFNGEYWGLYSNIQQLESTYLRQWFQSNDGTRWRARVGSPPPMNPGGSALNFNGPDTSNYIGYYELKRTEQDNPWEDLVVVCDKLNNLPVSELYDSLKYDLDVDRALWFLAQEIIFSDDDSYIFKGLDDYYIYWDADTERLVPLEVDANSVMNNRNLLWPIYFRQNNEEFPLMHRLMQNNALRQRYLAHFRTILENHFVVDKIHSRIDSFAAFIEEKVQNDPKAIYTYQDFLMGIDSLKQFVVRKRASLVADQEVKREGVALSNVVLSSSNGIGEAPNANEEASITVEIQGDVSSAFLYFGTGYQGTFERVQMFDDGNHNDGASNDGIFGGHIDGFEASTYVRYYIEARKNDGFGTASFIPEGAEHDVYIYQVKSAGSSFSDIVINELMADNDNVVQDNAGDYDDWIELYNNSGEAVDLSGYYISDDANKKTKWEFPENTVIEANSYLILWADDDEEQNTSTDLHTNFKLSKSGESVYLLDNEANQIDVVVFDQQEEDIAYARMPNGTGDFVKQEATFNSNNGGLNSTEDRLNLVEFRLFPNPVYTQLQITPSIRTNQFYQLQIYNTKGQLEYNQNTKLPAALNLSHLKNGSYILTIKDKESQIVFGETVIKM